jgi:hypothetical protein
MKKARTSLETPAGESMDDNECVISGAAVRKIDSWDAKGSTVRVVQSFPRLSEAARSGLGFSPCVMPDVFKWVASFDNKEARADLSAQCFEVTGLEIAKEAGWSPEELARVQSARRNRGNREQLRQSCDSQANLQMQREFFRSWSSAKMQCANAAISWAGALIRSEAVEFPAIVGSGAAETPPVVRNFSRD